MRLVSVECTTGCHRAHTTAYTVANAGSALCDADGDPLFNIKVFSLLEYTRNDSMMQQVDSAVMWSREPWRPNEEFPLVHRKDRYGYNACSLRKDASINFDIIWDWVDHFNKTQFVHPTPKKHP